METNTDNNILAQAMQHGIEQQLSLIEAHLQPQTTTEVKNSLFNPLRELSKSYAEIGTQFINKKNKAYDKQNTIDLTIDKFLEKLVNSKNQFILFMYNEELTVNAVFVSRENEVLIDKLEPIIKSALEEYKMLYPQKPAYILMINNSFTNPQPELIKITF